MKYRRFTCTAATALVATAAWVGGLGTSHVSAAPDEAQTALASVEALSSTFANVAEKASPAVVYIQVEKDIRPAANWRPYPGARAQGSLDLRNFFQGPAAPPFGRGEQGAPERRVPIGEGTGFLISSDGYIVTNHHVVGEADQVNVTLSDGRKFEARIVGTDPQTEIALVKVEATGLPSLQFADSDQVRVGEWVLAIGNPFGLSHSVTSGIISARGRADVGIVDYADFIQTDAAINPGNSGGPLLNMRGEVVGVNTAILSRTGGSNGVGFAIPVNMVKHVSGQLREHGAVSRGHLGIAIQDLTPEIASWFGVGQSRGILIAEVVEGSPAERAGLQRDDVIVGVDGQPVDDAGGFRSRIATTDAGKLLDLEIIRAGERINKQVEVGAKATEIVASNKNGKEGDGGARLGVSLQPLTGDVARELGYEGSEGVVVADVVPGSPAHRAGLRPGALITEVNRKQARDPKDVQAAVKESADQGTVLLRVREGNASRYVAVKIG